MKKYLLPRDEIKEDTVVALGDFDGVHLAHKKLMRETVKKAKEDGIASAVYIFDKNNKKGKVITSQELKESLIFYEGIEIIAVQETNEDFFKTSCEDFVKNIIKGKLNAKFVVAGRNYTFGKGGKGTSKLLCELCEKEGIKALIIEDVLYENKTISSSEIRNLLAEGDIEKANTLLGYNYIIKGKVEKGKQLGRTLGFPTANVYPEENIALPRFGVYLAEVEISGEKLKAIVNVGVRPTVNGKEPSVEAYIKGIERDLYGEEIKISFIKFIRGEKKFASVDELKKQIEADAEKGGLL